MTQYQINRSTETPEGSVVKFVKAFDSIEDALDTLYRQAKRHGYEVAVDNSVDGAWGFCLWQIHVKVGEWRYYVTEENEYSLEFWGEEVSDEHSSSDRPNGRYFQVVVGIYDTNTQIKLGQCTRVVGPRRGGSIRAEWEVLDDVKDAVLEKWAKPKFAKRYRLTAKQLNTMCRDHVVNLLESYTFKVERCRQKL